MKWWSIEKKNKKKESKRVFWVLDYGCGLKGDEDETG